MYEEENTPYVRGREYSVTVPANIKWFEPWMPESDGDDLLTKELRREVCGRHILFGINVRAVGTRIGLMTFCLSPMIPKSPLLLFT